jgi:glucose-1-phosphate adenylyltransferase
MPGNPHRALASMGIYVFNAAFLYDQLISDADEEHSEHDFGGDIIPRLVAAHGGVWAHRLRDSCTQLNDGEPYWRDVGTIDAFWDANMELTRVTPALDLYDQGWPIWTYQEQLPPAKFVFDSDDRRGAAIDSLVSGGCIVSGSTVRNSLLFSSVHVQDYCDIDGAVILPNAEIGRGVQLKRVVVEKGTQIPPGLRVGFDPEEDRQRFHVTSKGVTLVTPEMLGQQLHHLR